jgi:hypothetical protein
MYKRLDSWLAFLGCHRVYNRLRQAKSVSPQCPLRRGDGGEVPFAGHTLERVSAALLELQP